MSCIPIIIPSYEPDERLITLLEALRASHLGPVVVVNDGSDRQYDALFDAAAGLIGDGDPEGGVLLRHEVNRGKGAALKTAFSYVLEHQPDATGVITADSDGQHTPECITRVRQALLDKGNALVLGVRNFDGDNVPWKSRMGNKITCWVLARLTGIRISDTQTGLRGIPTDLMRGSLDLPGDRFEFETQMLTYAHNKLPFFEVPIQTIYDSKENHQTHFDPMADSLRIYRSLLQDSKPLSRKRRRQ